MLRGFWDASRTLEVLRTRETRCATGSAGAGELWQRVGLATWIRTPCSRDWLHRLRRPLGAVHLLSGPGRAYLAKLDSGQREQLRTELFKGLGEPAGEFTLSATACAVRGKA